MKLAFLYGLPGVGKLTVARELASITGYKLFHNHLVVDMLLSVFPFGSTSFVDLREATWLAVFEHAARGDLPGLIFTFAPEATVRPAFVPAAQAAIARAGGETVFIELICPRDVLHARLDTPDRRRYGKLTDAAAFDALDASGAFAMKMPPPRFSLDTESLSPDEAARRIAAVLR